jgi:transposase-like protein
MGERKKYTREFKEEAVRLLETSGKNGHEIERDLGIGTGQIYRWRAQLAQEASGSGIRAFPALIVRCNDPGVVRLVTHPLQPQSASIMDVVLSTGRSRRASDLRPVSERMLSCCTSLEWGLAMWTKKRLREGLGQGCPSTTCLQNVALRPSWRGLWRSERLR